MFILLYFQTQQGDGGVSSYLKEDKVPIPFLIMTILQFGLIIIDRALFLRKYILGKVVFQFFLVFGIHIWMFFILPAVTDRLFFNHLSELVKSRLIVFTQPWILVFAGLLMLPYHLKCGTW